MSHADTAPHQIHGRSPAAGAALVLLCLLALAPIVHGAATPEEDVSNLLVTAPLDVDPAGSTPGSLGPRRSHLALLLLPPALFAFAVWGRRRHWWTAAGVLLACAGTMQAGNAREAEFLWDQATARMTRARSSDDFIQAARTYRELIADGVRNRHVFYNLGTAWLKAGRPRRALDALERAERYAGAAPDIQHNMAVARHALGLSPNGSRPPWQRLLLFWHFGLRTDHRVTIALWAYAAFWLGLILRNASHPRLAGALLTLSLTVAVLFGTSAAASLLAERNARRTDQPGGQPQERVWQRVDPRLAAPTQGLHVTPPSRHAVAGSSLRSDTPNPASGIPHPESSLPNPDAPRLPHPLAPDDKNPSLVATLDLSPAHPYLYETFTVTLTLRATDVRLGQSLEIEGLPPPDVLHRGPFRELPPERDATGEELVEIRRYRVRARARTVDLPPLQLDVSVSVVDPKRDYGPDGEVVYRVPTDPLPLPIRPLPQTDRPSGFSGAVGQFAFDATLDRARVLAHHPVNLLMHIRGKGYLADLVPPALHHVAGCRLAAPEAMPTEARKQAVYRQAIVPQDTNRPALPAVTFIYFDPKAERYATRTAGPFTLRFGIPPRQARFAPSREAAATFTLPPTVTPTVLSSIDGWVKIQSGRRIGWLPAEQL